MENAHFVEFYRSPNSEEIVSEREIKSRDISLIEVHEYPYSFRFFKKDENGNKSNFSNRIWIGKELSLNETDCENSSSETSNSPRIIKTILGEEYEIGNDDIVFSVDEYFV